jgi:hypothetical protein
VFYGVDVDKKCFQVKPKKLNNGNKEMLKINCGFKYSVVA